MIGSILKNFVHPLGERLPRPPLEDYLTVTLHGTNGTVQLKQDSHVKFVTVTLEGRLSVLYANPKMFHCSSIISQSVVPDVKASIPFHVSLPSRCTLEMEHILMHIRQEGMDHKILRALDDQIIDDCETPPDIPLKSISENQLLPTYFCLETGTRVDYDVVVTVYTDTSFVSVSTAFEIEYDPYYPSPDAHSCLHDFFGLSDAFNNRVCVSQGNVKVPVPKPLKIGSTQEIDVFGLANENVVVTLCCYETIAGGSADRGQLVRKDTVYWGRVFHEKMEICTPADLYPSFTNPHLTLSYILHFRSLSMQLSVPVGVNYSGKECP